MNHRSFHTRLNLGAGPEERWLPGYLNIDIAQGGEAYPLPQFADGTVDEVRASHVLEHFPQGLGGPVLREWVRVLRPGGLLRVAVPDFEKIANAYIEDRDWPIAGYVMGGQIDRHDFHRAIYDREGLEEAFAMLGLVDIGPWESELPDGASLPVSLNLRGRKPGGEPVALPEGLARPVEPERELPERLGDAVVAVMSLPRLAFTDNMFCCQRAARDLGIALERRTGVFWDQAMQLLFERWDGGSAKYLLTIDYDSVFSTNDVRRLFDLMERRPEIDALCALQMRREKDSPLMCTGRVRSGDTAQITLDGEELAQETLPLRTGHFGLTLIRTAALAGLPKPWFSNRPGPTGSYDGDRMDADIWFWHQWAECGRSLHLALRVPIGHLQLACTWPDRRMQPLHQYRSDYDASGKPSGVWR